MKVITVRNGITAIAAAATLVGCERQNPAASEDRTATGEQVKETITNAATKTEQLASKAKDEVMAGFQKAITEMDTQIGELTEKSKSFSGQTKSEADEALAKLRTQREVAGKKFEELKTASQDTWQDVRSGFEEAWQELKRAYDAVKDKFRGE